MTIPQTEYQQRRQQLMQKMAPNSVAIICTGLEYPRTQDCCYRFRPNSNFYYMTGFAEPEAIAVLIPGREDGEYILFNRVRDPAKEIWDGPRAGQTGAVKEYLADQAFPIEDLDLIVPELLQDKSTLYYQYGFENGIDDEVISWRDEIRQQMRRGMTFPSTIINVTDLINEMRLIKSPAEIAVLRKAGAINIEAHKRGMKMCVAGMTERQLCSEILYVYGQQGCMDVAYDPIVANGNNACTLHYFAGNPTLKDGELVLIDMGEEYAWYASDITRTFPVNGKFTTEQRAIYELVLSVQNAIIQMVKPGLNFSVLQQTAIQLLTEGLVKLGLLKGSVEQLIAEKAYVAFYPHSISHWMGLDVHDVSNYKVNGQWRDLEVGMVFTVEPGIYIQPDNENVDAKWRGIGVRIEDNIVVTTTGCENLTAQLPKTVNDIEALMNQ